MVYQKLIVELTPLSDETAAALHHFLYELMYAVDEYYYRQIQKYYIGKSVKKLLDVRENDELSDPPF